MRTDPNGQRFYTAEDVSHERVREAMRKVGDRITTEQLDVLRAHGEHPCVGVDRRTKLRCNTAAIGLYGSGYRCAEHTPAAEHGRPETVPTCNAPVRCYCPKCATAPDPHELNDHARAELTAREQEWVNTIKAEVLTLCSIGGPFTLAAFAEFLPPARDSTRPLVEQRVLDLLDEGVERGIITRHPSRAEWKGAR